MQHLVRLLKPLLLVLALGALGGCRWMSDYYIGKWNVKNEEYSYGIIRLERFLEKHPKPNTRRQVAMMKLGRAYLEMRAYHNARRTFEQYLQEFPSGKFVDTAQDALSQIKTVASEREKELETKLETAQEKVEELEAELEKEPQNADKLVALGNAYWHLGKYKSAGEAYLEAITHKPELRSDPLMQERLIFDLNGNLVPIESKAQRVALEREREPVVVENVHEYGSRGTGDFFAARRRFYVVTGRVRNQSTRPLLGVKVQVTLYDSLGQILEVGTSNIGTLYPQQTRPFVVKSGLDAEAMNNITRYEYDVLYQN